MKRYMAFTVVAIVAAMLLISPAMAAYTTVNKGGDVFLGEEGLDVTSAFVNVTDYKVDWYPSGSKVGEDVPQTESITPSDFYVAPAMFTDRLGNWYVSGTNQVAFVVKEPRIYDIKVVNGATDVTGDSVSAGTYLDFRIETNLYTIRNRPGSSGDFPFNIKVRTPDGASLTSLVNVIGGQSSLRNLPVDSDLYMWTDGVANNRWDTGAKSGGSKVYPSGKYIVTAECNVNSIKDNYDHVGKTSSTEKTVSIASDTLAISAKKSSVIRGSQFTVTVNGKPNTEYFLYIKNPGTDNAPYLTESQEGVEVVTDTEAFVTTDKNGGRNVGFSTNKDTKDKTYTIRVETLPSADKSDEVSVKVSAGKVSIVAPGSESYYLGQEIEFEGINTETDTVYFFITGPNLPSSGGQLSNPRKAVITGDESTFDQSSTAEDDTYTFKWSTAMISLDSGAYTVYAVSSPNNRNDLSDVAYDTASINIRKPFITAEVSSNIIAKGDKLLITGDAGNQPTPGVAVWVLGKNKVIYETVSVDDDNTYEFELKSGETQDLANGQYFVVVQHPMYNDEFDVYPNADESKVLGSYPVAGSVKFKLQGAGSLQGSDAAEALVNAIEDPSVDDVYSRINFMINEPVININAVPLHKIGQNLTISGTTNLAIGDQLLVEVVSSSFSPTQKTQSGDFSGSSGTTKVVAGDGSMNAFSIEFATKQFKEDEYIVNVEGVIVPASSSILFDVVAVTPTPTQPPTPIPTTVITTQPTPVPTTIVTTIPTTTPPTTVPTPPPTTKSPGFGAIVALVGLGVVGWLVVRKD